MDLPLEKTLAEKGVSLLYCSAHQFVTAVRLVTLTTGMYQHESDVKNDKCQHHGHGGNTNLSQAHRAVGLLGRGADRERGALLLATSVIQ